MVEGGGGGTCRIGPTCGHRGCRRPRARVGPARSGEGLGGRLCGRDTGASVELRLGRRMSPDIRHRSDLQQRLDDRRCAVGVVACRTECSGDATDPHTVGIAGTSVGRACRTRRADGDAAASCIHHGADSGVQSGPWWLSHHGNLGMGRLGATEALPECPAVNGRVPRGCTD